MKTIFATLRHFVSRQKGVVWHGDE